MGFFFLQLCIAKQWRQTHASTQLETCNKEGSQQKERNGPKAWPHFSKETWWQCLLKCKCGNFKEGWKHQRYAETSVCVQHGLKFHKCQIFDASKTWAAPCVTITLVPPTGRLLSLAEKKTKMKQTAVQIFSDFIHFRSDCCTTFQFKWWNGKVVTDF